MALVAVLKLDEQTIMRVRSNSEWVEGYQPSQAHRIVILGLLTDVRVDRMAIVVVARMVRVVAVAHRQVVDLSIGIVHRAIHLVCLAAELREVVDELVTERIRGVHAGQVEPEGAHHQRLRRLVSNIMKNNILGDAAAYSHAATERLLQSLDAHLQSDASNSVEIGEMLRLLTLQVIGTAVLGLDPEESNRELPQLYLPIIEECNDRVWFPPRMFLPTKSNIMFSRHVNQLNAFIVRQIRKRQAERNSPTFNRKAPPRDILDRFFEGYEDKFDDTAVLQVDYTLLFCACIT